MNKEEIWKNTRHFKIESNYGKFDLIETDIYLDLLNKYNDLQHQLEEKQKIIDEAVEYIRNGRDGKGQFYKCCERKVSIKDDEELLEILERESEE